jgi:hypothetical protein
VYLIIWLQCLLTLTPSSVQHTLYLCTEMSLFQLIFHLRRPLTLSALSTSTNTLITMHSRSPSDSYGPSSSSKLCSLFQLLPGADVRHPGPEVKNQPSMTSLVWSWDTIGYKVLSHMQSPRRRDARRRDVTRRRDALKLNCWKRKRHRGKDQGCS